MYQLYQTFTALDAKSAPALVRIGANKNQIVLRGIDGDGRRLVLPTTFGSSVSFR